MSESERLKATIYVGGLEGQVTSETVYDAFIPFGDIVHVNLPKPELPSSKETHRGFGYIEFDSAEDAAEAVDNMDQAEIFGRVLKVAKAKAQKNWSDGLGSKTAIWEQDSIAQDKVEVQDTVIADEEELDPIKALNQFDVAGPRQV